MIALGLWLVWRGLPIFRGVGSALLGMDDLFEACLATGHARLGRDCDGPRVHGLVHGRAASNPAAWLAREVQNARGTAVLGGRLWSIRWTASLVTLIVLMFMVGLAATGIVHQVGWLIASRRSVLEPKPLFRGVWGTSADHLRDLALRVEHPRPGTEPQEGRRF